MDDTDVCFAGAAAQAELVRSGEVSAAELTQVTLERIDEIDPSLGSYRVVMHDEALATAAAIDAADHSDDTRPLLGVPVAIKDNLDVAGQAACWGSRAITSISSEDEPLVAALRDAGAVIVGKTASSELAAWPFTDTPEVGITRNPWNPDFSPGGSSGGSGAAVASGLCGLAVGSDGLGSIRVPANFCGVFGIKPQRNRVPHSNRENWHGLSVNGPITRTVADAAAFLDAVAPGDPPGFSAALAQPLQPLTVAIAWDAPSPFDRIGTLGDDQRKGVDDTAEALRELGHTVVEQRIGWPLHTQNSATLRYASGVAESAADVDRPELLTKRTRHMAGFGRRVPARALAWALRYEAKIVAAVDEAFAAADVVLTPAAIDRPTRIGELDGKGGPTSLLISGKRIPHFGVWNVAGNPAMSVPAGFDAGGLPVGAHLAGRTGDEATLLALAAQLEEARPWAHHRPG